MNPLNFRAKNNLENKLHTFYIYNNSLLFNSSLLGFFSWSFELTIHIVIWWLVSNILNSKIKVLWQFPTDVKYIFCLLYSKRLVFNFMQFVLIVIKATRRFHIFDRKRQTVNWVFILFFKPMLKIVLITESFHHYFFLLSKKFISYIIMTQYFL